MATNNEEISKVLAKAWILIDKKITDDLGIRIDSGTIICKKSVIKDIESMLNQLKDE